MQPHGDTSYYDLSEYRRVLQYLEWGTAEEKKKVLLITLAGILGLGFVGFGIFSLMLFLPG